MERYNRGLIISIYGTMFSGKTKHLIKIIKELEIKDPQIFQWHPSKRSERQLDNVIWWESHTDLFRLIEEKLAEGHKTLIFEESHFLPDVFIEKAKELQIFGINLIFCGLELLKPDTREFIARALINMATVKIRMKEAFCSTCFKNKSVIDYKKQTSDDNMVGGSDKYLTLCAKCYIKADKYAN